jgi:CheY-like chemotaxis protein
VATLLIADGYEDDEMLTRRTLRRECLIDDVVFARSGSQLIAMLDGCRPDAILLDPSLPLLSMAELAARRKADREIGAVPLVVLADARDPRLDGVRVASYLAKPIELEPLIAAMARCGLRLAYGSSPTGAAVRHFVRSR